MSPTSPDQPVPPEGFATLEQVRGAVEERIKPSWVAMRATLERAEHQAGSYRYVLSFYRWFIELKLEPYPRGGVLLTAALTPRHPIRRAIHAIADPVHDGWTQAGHHLIRGARETGATLEKVEWAIGRRPDVDREYAARWRERGIRVGVDN